MAPKKGKTASRGTVAVKINPQTLIASASTGNERRIIPLGGGSHIYLFHPVTGKNTHLAVASEAFDTTIAEHAELSPAYARRLSDELALWPQGDLVDARQRLVDNGVLPA